MTRIFTEGFELGDKLFFTECTADLDNGVKRTGNYSIRCNGYQNLYLAIKTFSPHLSELYIRWGSRIAEATTPSNIYLLYFRHSAYGERICRVMFQSDMKLKWNGGGADETLGTDLVTGTYVHSYNKWYLIEAYVKIAESGSLIARTYDGNTLLEEISYSGDTRFNGYTDVGYLLWSASRGSGNYYYQNIDDLAMNDTNGSEDNSWCGDGHIEYQQANDNGDSSQWLGSDGDRVNNYALVDEVPSNEDTDYVKEGTAGNRDMYQVADFSGAGKIIRRIYPEVRAKDNHSGGGLIKLGHKNDGNVYLCSSNRTMTGSYARVVGDEALINPFDSEPWENADINAMQFVSECE